MINSALKSAVSIENKTNISKETIKQAYVDDVCRDITRVNLAELIYYLQDIKLIKPENEFHAEVLAEICDKLKAEFERRKAFKVSNKVDENIIRVIKERADITDVLSIFTEVFTNKNQWQYRCTLHGADNHPSGVIYRNQNRAWCYVCNKGGDVIEIVKLFGNLDFPTTIKLLCQECGINPELL